MAPTPTGDPRAYYAERRELFHMEADRTIPETSAQPRTESSMEAMDTDEGQRTTARLLERLIVFQQLPWNLLMLP